VYIPAHFAAGDVAQVAAFVDQVGAADLVTFDGTRLVSSLLPVIWDRTPGEPGPGEPGPGEPGPGEPGSGEHGRLLGHLALANPQWQSARLDVPALAIVHGPQAYISPSWYQSTKEHGRTVPTWNYTAVHFTGTVTFHQDADWLRGMVTRLTERYEQDRAGRWWVADAPAKYIDGQLRAIVGVEMAISQVEAKDKLSQNRGPADRAGVIAALRAEQDPDAHAIADLMATAESASAQPGRVRGRL
jgi:transcriptional regulator